MKRKHAIVELPFVFGWRIVLPAWRSGMPDNVERGKYISVLPVALTVLRLVLPRPAPLSCVRCLL